MARRGIAPNPTVQSRPQSASLHPTAAILSIAAVGGAHRLERDRGGGIDGSTWRLTKEPAPAQMEGLRQERPSLKQATNALGVHASPGAW